jgi:hypothetical protein
VAESGGVHCLVYFGVVKIMIMMRMMDPEVSETHLAPELA